MKKINLLLPAFLLLGLASCTTQGVAKKTKWESEIGRVDIVNVLSSSEIESLFATASDNLKGANGIKRSKYKETITSSEGETAIYSEEYNVTIESDRYAKMEANQKYTANSGNALGVSEEVKGVLEFLIGDKKQLLYTKTAIEFPHKGLDKGEACNVSEITVTDPRAVDYAWEYVMADFDSFGSTITGTDNDDHLYMVHYSESTTRIDAYDEKGQACKGLEKKLMHQLFDLGSKSAPRLQSMRNYAIKAKNIDEDGYLIDSFITYDLLRDNIEISYGDKKESTDVAKLLASFPRNYYSELKPYVHNNTLGGAYQYSLTPPSTLTQYPNGSYAKINLLPANEYAVNANYNLKVLDRYEETLETFICSDKVVNTYINGTLINDLSGTHSFEGFEIYNNGVNIIPSQAVEMTITAFIADNGEVAYDLDFKLAV
ncbi:MAG: hypothetical protein K5694_04090 [Bacilli bacterium]|nr:hypothetical protein [Bacilli bacterium]